ncbi:hypothetical protein GGH94_004721 [Coemansia aciculifera]|uniref:Peptidase S1 domain-containing protein n=1 Tax=Coemansia aciculifera TaxID=417176 RepID=A0A9W8M1X6_9FUNG|nr:hypothetical protein GGH94_004721 [Coemansia aciculifera]KAJ2871702.1 hypothetical protein GGH93_004617 [Coemansia aciculifera]
MAVFGLLLLLVLSAAVAAPSAASVLPRQLQSRASASDIFKVKGGLLVKNGKQTSCGLGILDNMAALISADCLDFVNGKVDLSLHYEAFVDAGYDGATGRYMVQNITVHPSYDSKTKANNIALIEYNRGSKVLWYNYNAVGPGNWDGYVYVQRYLSDIDGMAWATPKVYSQGSGDLACLQLSTVYKGNSKGFACSSGLVPAPSSSLGTSCNVPYQMVYATFSGTYVYQAGFFSHVVLEDGKDLCKYSRQRSYFTLISDYLAFANSVLDRTVYYYNKDNTTKPQSDPEYAMTKPSTTVVSVVMLSGNMYPKQPSTPSPTSALLSRTSTSTSPTSNPPSEEQQESNSGLSKRSIAIVAACSAVGSLLLAVGVFFLVRWWRGHLKRTRDPYKETAAQEILANDLGGASMPGGGGNLRSMTEIVDMAYAMPPPPAYPANEPQVLVVEEAQSPNSLVSNEYPNEKS